MDVDQEELNRYRALNLATVKYTSIGPMKVVIDAKPELKDHFAKVEEKIEEFYAGEKLPALMKYFKDLSEVFKHDPDYNNYIQQETGYDIDSTGMLNSRIETILNRGLIESDDEYRDVVEALSDVGPPSPISKADAVRFNNLLTDYEGSIKKDL